MEKTGRALDLWCKPFAHKEKPINRRRVNELKTIGNSSLAGAGVVECFMNTLNDL